MTFRTYRLFISALLSTLALSAAAYTSSYYTNSSALSTGKWVKVKVSHTGIHQISHSTLRELGFDNPSEVAVFGYGGARLTSNAFDTSLPDDLKATPALHTDDGRMLFYAEADLSVSAVTATTIEARRNLYDTEACYFLTDSRRSPELPDRLESTPDGTALDTHLSVCYVENEVQNPADGGAVFHDKPFGPGDSCDYDFEISDFHPDDRFATGYFRYSFGAYASTNTALSPVYPDGLSVSAVKNNYAGLQIQETKFYSIGSGSATVTDVEADGVYTVSFRLPEGSAPKYTAMDYAWLIYPRLNRLKGNSIVMNFPGMKAGDCFSIAGSCRDMTVWDITDAATVTPCQTYSDGDTYTAVCPGLSASPKSRRIIAFDSSCQFPEPTPGGEIANQNLHGEQVPEMVIITTDQLAPAAERLADIHRKLDGMNVKVVTQQTIFNEFSSGARAAMGYRRYLKMLYDREPKTIKHVLLYGHGTWDNRRRTTSEQLICYGTENADQARDLTKNFTSDKYFVMLENSFSASRLHFGIMSLAIGRIDVTTEAEADKINAKIERFIKRQRGHDVYGNILVLSDDGDSQGHFIDAEKVIAEMAGTNESLNYTRVHNLIYPWTDGVAISGRKAITNALKTGQGLLVYCGHCSHIAFTGERLYDLNLMTSSECDDYPFALLATCETFGFDRNSHVVGPSMLRMDNGGAIGIIGSCRSVYMEYNRTLACALAKAYAEATPATTIGDISRNAHNYCIRTYKENDRAANNLCYNLCGDPALRVGAPHASIAIDRINGMTPASDSPVELHALKTITIEGHIEGHTGFCGDVLVRVFDTPYTVKTNERTKGEDNTVSYDVTLDEKILAMSCTQATGGKFSATITLPEAFEGDSTNRIMISAISNDGSLSAAYSSANFKVLPADSNSNEPGQAPVISEMYLGTPSFTEGSIVSPSVVLHATIEVPSSGLNLSAMFTSGIRLMLDKRTSYQAVAESVELHADGTASLTFPISGLSDGRHELTLSAISNTGASTSRSIAFAVVDSSVDCQLAADTEIAREEISFTLTHGFNAEPTGRLVIEDASGTTVFSTDSCSYPFSWDLRDNDGQYVADGRYRAYAILRDDLNYSSTKAVDFTVIR